MLKNGANITQALVWPITLLLIVVITATAALVALGHSEEVRAAGIVLAQGAGFLLNFWVASRVRKSGTTNDDLAGQLDQLGKRLTSLEKTVAQPPA